jgi:hypothetical protein
MDDEAGLFGRNKLILLLTNKNNYMPINLVYLQSLSKEQVEALKVEKTRVAAEFRTNLLNAENRLNDALADRSVNVTQLGLLISLKTEKTQELENVDKDLQMITAFIEGKVKITDPKLPGSGGGFSIRPDDSRNIPVEGAKTYGEIMKEANKKPDVNLEDVLKKLEKLTYLVDSLGSSSKPGRSAETTIQTS